MQARFPVVGPATVQHVGSVPDRSTARPHDGVVSSPRASGEDELLPAIGNSAADLSSAAPRALPVGSGQLRDPLDLTSQHAQPSTPEGNGAAPDDVSEVSPLAAFGSPVHGDGHCPHKQPPAESAEELAAGWWCEGTDGTAAVPRGGGQQHSKPRWRGSTALPRPSPPGLAGNKENDCAPTPAPQVGHLCVGLRKALPHLNLSRRSS